MSCIYFLSEMIVTEDRFRLKFASVVIKFADINYFHLFIFTKSELRAYDTSKIRAMQQNIGFQGRILRFSCHFIFLCLALLQNIMNHLRVSLNQLWKFVAICLADKEQINDCLVVFIDELKRLLFHES